MQLEKCRVCQSPDLDIVLDMGEMAFTGIFPKPGEKVPRGRLALALCEVCGLTQLADSYNPSQLYGGNYGYRSSLNGSMVSHLREIVDYAHSAVSLDPGDVVLDIGSNDGTLLSQYDDGLTRVGVDPTIARFGKFYDHDIIRIPSFFFADVVQARVKQKARIITSIAMFYDLEDPIRFAKDIATVLDEDGIWIFEQSYLPLMLAQNAYDTICHEHLEYYTVEAIDEILDCAGLKITGLDFNRVNGGSVRVTAAHKTAPYEPDEWLARSIQEEWDEGYNTRKPFDRLSAAMEKQRGELRELLVDLKGNGKTVFGYGASTKGNVLLQYCGIGPDLLTCIAEVNEDKFGKVTSTGIPIVREDDAAEKHPSWRWSDPDYFLVLPWHFKEDILARNQDFLARGGKFIFPLPEVEIIG